MGRGKTVFPLISFPCLPCTVAILTAELRTWRCWCMRRRLAGWLVSCLTTIAPCLPAGTHCTAAFFYRQNCNQNSSFHSFIHVSTQWRLNQCFPVCLPQAKSTWSTTCCRVCSASSLPGQSRCLRTGCASAPPADGARAPVSPGWSRVRAPPWCWLCRTCSPYHKWSESWGTCLISATAKLQAAGHPHS